MRARAHATITCAARPEWMRPRHTGLHLIVARIIVDDGVIGSDELTACGPRVWLMGHDPVTGKESGRQRPSPHADLLLDGTLNHPKS